MPSLYYNDKLIANVIGDINSKNVKKLIQRHLNDTNKKYQYVVKQVKEDGPGVLNLAVLARGDASFKSEELIVKSYSIK